MGFTPCHLSPNEVTERGLCAVSYTFGEAYETVFPSTRHHSVGKETGKTNHIERFNCTLRQQFSRLLIKTLSFSKKLENKIILGLFGTLFIITMIL